MANRLTVKDIQHIPDGTWIETDSQMTKILRTWDMNEPRPKGVYFLWRWKQLRDQLAYGEYLDMQGAMCPKCKEMIDNCNCNK